MNKITLTILLTGLLAAGSLYGAMWRFHFGRIACAEITTSPVKIINEDKHAFPNKPGRPAYAIIVCKLDSARTLSIYDFSLTDGINKFPCVALRAGTGEFDGKNWKIESTSSASWYSMLFMVETPRTSNNGPVEMTLEYSYQTRQNSNLKVPFKFIGSTTPTSVSKIPEDGLLPQRK